MANDDLEQICRPGAEIAVRVTPRAARNRLARDDAGDIRVYVTSVPEKGKATAAAQKLLAKALGVPKTRLTLVRGASARDKVFRID
ncbi:DUF167 domain-containing protein [Sediminimonas sp.]|jgi:uncharacterized protein YggU (UPF0235/DUF167 family)|uniref:DUF167 domain-containing protein n=1 Tax=Sediminimonas sp. TaxID=2823379 RepID=UPI0025DE13A6|nr:DUF167 domain-containing protein [Sediminimonas sp.]